ncbi:MAG: class I SAM-dependent methyltransferase [Candidatus Pacearchaeota archaeon]|nr:MAG: class I SAM-dependent methyltransferase [Candidatus Pacearchaeota archaeon]
MKQNQEKVWDAIAEQWYHFRQRPFRDITAEIDKITSEFKPGKILDIGCGNCRHLLPFFKRGFDCYGIDFSSEMLKYAKEFSKKYDFKVKLKKAKAEKLPFKNKSFNYVLSVAVLHHLKKKEQEKAIKEIYRILKPGGIALVSVWNKYPLLSLFVKEKYEKWTVKGKTYYRYFYMFTSWELKKLLKKNGFEISKSKVGKNIILIVRKIL